jgi:poly(A) polymerase
VLPERLQPLVQATGDLSERFRSAGHSLYLVGGSVRDAIVADGAAPPGPDHDLDFTTDARPDEIEAILRGWADAVWTQGKRFGTIGARRGGQTYEITTHRAEVYRPDSRKPEVAFGDLVEDDLSRRDFTINAMALRLPELELVDPFGGLADLSARRLRTPLGP